MADQTVITLSEVKRRRRRLLVRAALILLGVLVLAAVIFGWRIHVSMKASLPQLDGTASVAGLAADVTITRDAFGVPTIRAANRVDAARATGFLHAQDRFFQMDLARRRAGGELAELFGERALAADKAARIHGFREIAKKSLALLPSAQRDLLNAYTEGVNAGLAQLGARPFEYLLLRETPRTWLPEDSILVIDAMAMDLQHPDAAYERSLGIIIECYNQKVADYFAPQIAPDDSALDGSSAPLPPIPDAWSINLRPRGAAAQTAMDAPRLPPPVFAEGSNSMAVAGKHGAGMIENDMHLNLRVPNTWYRVSMNWGQEKKNTITGITHPGAPVIVAGSNGRIAWGFTNSFADTSDVVILMPDILGSDFYYANSKIVALDMRTEKINVRGESKPVDFYVETSVWGPVIGKNKQGRKLALSWVFHDPAAANFDLIELETATSIHEATDIAHHAGIPAQNMLVTDQTGDIGWTICGRIPERFGYDGRVPVTWSFGDRGWRGLLPPEKIPSLSRSGSSGQTLSTANQRLFGGDTMKTLGDGGARPGQRGARVQQLLSRLNSDGNPAPHELLAIALDDHAPFLSRWHELLRDTLAAPDAVKNKTLARLREAAGETWDENLPTTETSQARASVNSAAYPIVRKFREHVIARVLTPIFEPCVDAYPEFNYRQFHVEEPVWNILQKKPTHLLAPDYANWDALLLAAAQDACADLSRAGFSNPADARWGAFNVSRIRHPLSGGLFGLIGCLFNLNMPAVELPGYDDMPRVQYPDNGASERFVVAPSDEEHGIYEMPGGQSGHPLSPYYRAGHEAWVRGEPTPFLPGTPQHTLILKK